MKREKVNVTQRSVSSSSGEGAALVAKYNIAKFPSLVITGELNKTQQLASLWLQIGTLRADAVIIDPQPPYYSVAQGRVVGLVNITRITDTSCVNCASIGDVIDSFRGYGAVFSSDISVEYNSPQGHALIEKFGIRQVPAAIISSDILDYIAIAQVWPQLNATEKDGYYAVHVLQAP